MSIELNKDELNVCNNCVMEFMKYSDDEINDTINGISIPTDPRKIQKCFQLIREKTMTLNSELSSKLYRRMQKSICILFLRT